MKTLRLLAVLSVFLMQSALLPYSYAANASATVEQVTADAIQIEKAKQMVQQFFSISLADKKPLDIVQIGAYLYTYDVYGENALDFYRGPDARAFKIVDEFISKYAPNLGFTVAGQQIDQANIEQKAITWNKNFNKEYLNVIAYIQSIQLKYKNKNITTPATSPTPPKSTTTTNPTGKTNCELLMEKLMQEYNTLISINAPYEKIADVKSRINKAESGADCGAIKKETLVTKEVAKQANEEAISSVKKALNFEALNIRVIPEKAGAYCESSAATTLRNQLSTLPVEDINIMKQTITDLMEDPIVQESAVKANALDAISQELSYAGAYQASADGQSKSAFRNMIQGLYLMGNSIINSDGVNSIMDIIETNIDKLSYFGEFIGEQFEGLGSVRSQGGSTYTRDGNTQSFSKTSNANGPLSFIIPANNKGNNATFSIVAAKSQIINISEKTEVKGPELSLSDFVSQAKKHGAIWSYPIYPSSLGDTLATEIASYGGEMYDGKNTYLNVYVAEVNGQQRLFKDRNLSAVMPAGKFSTPWNMSYIVGSEGKLIDIYRTEELPKQLKGKIEIAGKLTAGFRVDIVHDEQAIKAGRGSSFPLSIKGDLFLAPYLISFELKRNLVGSTWNIEGSIGFNGPAICGSSISLSAQYDDDGSYSGPIIGSADETNVKNISLTINHNQNKITANIGDFLGAVSAIEDFNSVPENEGNITGIMDIANEYAVVSYLFDNTLLATIIADPDSMASVVYNDDSRESLIDLLGSYTYLLRLDRVMKYLGPLFEGSDKEEYPDESPTNSGDEKPVDYRKFRLNSYVNDGVNITVDYLFQSKDGMVVDSLYPDKVNLVTYMKGDDCPELYCTSDSYYLSSIDGFSYSEEYSYLLGDPSIVAAYIYASYTDPSDGVTFDSTYYIIGSKDSISTPQNNDSKPIQDTPPAQPATTYSLGAQSTYQETTNTEDWVFALYENDIFLEYIYPTVILHKTEGIDCYLPESMCIKTETELYAADIDGIPTYTIDRTSIDDSNVYEAGISLQYTDMYGSMYSQSFSIKKP